MANSESAIFAFIGRYRKSLTALVGFGLSIAAYVGLDNEIVVAVIGLATAFGVYALPNNASPGQGKA